MVCSLEMTSSMRDDKDAKRRMQDMRTSSVIGRDISCIRVLETEGNTQNILYQVFTLSS